MLSGKRIILGVTGGIAAYKAVYLLREFQKLQAEVRVTLTPSATRFVGVETFSSLSGEPAAVHIFPKEGESTDWTRHIKWGEWADLFVIAPCTANTLSKIAHGLSDNMLTSTVLAARCPILICPTMDGVMYESPSVEQNLKLVQSFGYHVLEPEDGFLASGLEGKGRLPELSEIISRASSILSPQGSLTGKKVVVTAGPTQEFIDPVRFISNPSSGKMGFAMAEAARNLGASVHLVHGPVHIDAPIGITTEGITSSSDLFDAMKTHRDADIIIMAAAVSDFTPSTPKNQKIKKGQADPSLQLTHTQDILKWLGEHKPEHQTLIGFAMETEDLIKNAKTKLETKNLDWIIANSLTEQGAGFQGDTNAVTVLSSTESLQYKGTKKEVARQVLTHIFPE
ncbi:MAG: bifunctional phosphopantothenoylcysteine decarboxylase/phosphopantothenate--cysteine ligase CoaBC [Bacteroidota bacterium]